MAGTESKLPHPSVLSPRDTTTIMRKDNVGSNGDTLSPGLCLLRYLVNAACGALPSTHPGHSRASGAADRAAVGAGTSCRPVSKAYPVSAEGSGKAVRSHLYSSDSVR